ncbi:OsmC family protein, partial [Streptomyces sp. DSM 42041]
MASQERALYTTTATSLHGPDRVEFSDAEGRSLPVVAPPAPGGHDGEVWAPEQFYAAAIATCLHQAIAVVASEIGADLAESRVAAEVQLEHSGALRYSLRTRVVVELPAT